MFQRVIFLSACLCVAVATNANAQTPQHVRVELTSGRTLEGIIDTKSSDEQLVLRFERGSAVLWRPIPWQEISAAKLDERRLTGEELQSTFRPFATTAKSPAERRRIRDLELSPSDIQPGESSAASIASRQSPARVVSLAADAYLANWDQDVEADGLVVELQPSDTFQQLVVAGGTLEVEMHALQASAFHHRANSRGRSLQPILRWAQSVTANDYTSRGAVLRIPFQAAHPEFDDSLGWYGLVHLKFSIPGSGVFERSIDGVRIRPWSPLRDYLQMDTGYRWLPHEGTGRGKTSWFTDDQ